MKKTNMRLDWKIKIIITALIFGLLIYFDAIVSNKATVNEKINFGTNFLGLSLLGLLHRKFLAKEMKYVAHLWFEKIDLE